MNDLMDFEEILRKSVICNNIKCHKKSGLHPISGKYILRKTIDGLELTSPPLAFLKLNYVSWFIEKQNVYCYTFSQRLKSL